MDALQFAIIELTLMFIGFLIIQVVKTAVEQMKETIDYWMSRKENKQNIIEKRNYLFTNDNFIKY